MKAIVIREFGGPELLRPEEVPVPVPGPGEVLIEVHAVSVNRTLDLVVRAGKYARPVSLPHILGVDPSGIIRALGPGVTSRSVGDRVVSSSRLPGKAMDGGPLMLGVHVWGGYAEYVKLPAANTYLIPDSLDFAVATVVARHGPTALSLLRDVAGIKAGEWVLVMGAAGGLGSAGVQAAGAFGAKVIAAAGADERVCAAIELGADYGVNYRSQDLAAEVRRLTEGRGVDVVFENVGDAELFPKALASLARSGRLVTAGGHAGGVVPLDVNRLYLNHLTIVGATGSDAHLESDMETSLKAAAAGRYRALIDRVMPLAQAAEAHRVVAGRIGLGKVILAPRA